MDILAPTHLIVILIIALLVLGPKRLPDLGQSLGKTLREFKQAVSSSDTDSGDTTVETAKTGNQSLK